jgi:hypothetical protein
MSMFSKYLFSWGDERKFYPNVPKEPSLKVILHTALLVSSQMYLFIMDLPTVSAEKQVIGFDFTP